MLLLFKRKDSCVMKVKRYQNGGSDPIKQRLERERLSEAVQRMLDSGNFKLGPSGELLRVSAEEANQAALQQSRVAANPAKYSPTTVGFMTPERKRYLENLDRRLTPEEAREYGTVSFDPSENPNFVFGMAAGSTPVEPIGALVGQGIKAAGKSAAKASTQFPPPVSKERATELMMQARTNTMGIQYRGNDTGKAFLFDGTIDRLRKKGMSEADIQDYIKRKGNTAEFTRGVKALDDLTKKQADDRLQNLADRAVREGAREESQAVLNLQQEAQKIIDDLNLAGQIDEIEYNALLNDVENLFNLSPGGKVSDFPEQFASELNKTLAKLGLDAKSATKKLVKDADKAFMMNQSGGKMKVLRKKVPGMSVSKSMMR